MTFCYFLIPDFATKFPLRTSRSETKKYPENEFVHKEQKYRAGTVICRLPLNGKHKSKKLIIVDLCKVRKKKKIAKEKTIDNDKCSKWLEIKAKNISG